MIRRAFHRVPPLGLGAAACLLSGLIAPGPALASEDAGVRSVFAYGAGNRALALGGAFTAVSDDASAPLWNPGGLGFIPRRHVLLTRASLYGEGIAEEFAGVVLPDWRFGVAALTLRHLGVGGIEERDDRNVLLGDDLSDSEMEIGLAYGRRLGEAVSVGGALKLRHQSLAGFSGSAFGGDVGVLAYPGVYFAPEETWSRRLAAGLSIRNLLDTSLRLDQEEVADPTTARLGLAYDLPFGGGRRVLAAIDYEDSPNLDAVVHAGLEVRVHPLVALRTGMNGGSFTAGTGINWEDFSFDYVFEENSLGNVHRFGLAWHFGASVEESRMASLQAEEARLATQLEEAFAQREKDRIQELVVEAGTQRSLGNVDEALEILTVAATLHPSSVDVKALQIQCLFDRGAALEAEGSFAEAAVVYARVQELAPGDTVAPGRADRARNESARRAARSQEIQTLFAKALDALSRGDLAAARQGFRALLTMDPKDAEARALLVRTEDTLNRQGDDILARADRLTRSGFFAEASDAIAEARRLGVEGVRLQRAEASLAAAKKARPGDVAATTTSRALTLPLSGEKLREIEDLYKRGLAAMEAGRSEDAVRYWEIVAAADPGYQQVREHLKREYLMRGMDSFAAGRLDEAILTWEKAVRLDPGDQKAKGYLARAREQQSRSREIFGGSGR